MQEVEVKAAELKKKEAELAKREKASEKASAKAAATPMATAKTPATAERHKPSGASAEAGISGPAVEPVSAGRGLMTTIFSPVAAVLARMSGAAAAEAAAPEQAAPAQDEVPGTSKRASARGRSAKAAATPAVKRARFSVQEETVVEEVAVGAADPAPAADPPPAPAAEPTEEDSAGPSQLQEEKHVAAPTTARKKRWDTTTRTCFCDLSGYCKYSALVESVTVLYLPVCHLFLLPHEENLPCHALRNCVPLRLCMHRSEAALLADAMTPAPATTRKTRGTARKAAAPEPEPDAAAAADAAADVPEPPTTARRPRRATSAKAGALHHQGPINSSRSVLLAHLFQCPCYGTAACWCYVWLLVRVQLHAVYWSSWCYHVLQLRSRLPPQHAHGAHASLTWTV